MHLLALQRAYITKNHTQTLLPLFWSFTADRLLLTYQTSCMDYGKHTHTYTQRERKRKIQKTVLCVLPESTYRIFSGEFVLLWQLECIFVRMLIQCKCCLCFNVCGKRIIATEKNSRIKIDNKKLPDKVFNNKRFCCKVANIVFFYLR